MSRSTIHLTVTSDGEEVSRIEHPADAFDPVAALEVEVQGIKQRADQAADNASNADARNVGKAVAGPPT